MAPLFSLLLLFLFLFLLLQSCRLSTAALPSLTKRASLSVENPDDVLVSPSGAFSAGFFPVGNNAYGFAVWFSDPPCTGATCTPVWMANRQVPVNGRRSTFSLLDSGNLVLTDASHAATEVWSSSTSSPSAAKLRLNDTGNLVLTDDSGVVLWQSFDSPTDTLLPLQPLASKTSLISARSRCNYSTGFYKLYFDDDDNPHCCARPAWLLPVLRQLLVLHLRLWRRGYAEKDDPGLRWQLAGLQPQARLDHLGRDVGGNQQRLLLHLRLHRIGSGTFHCYPKIELLNGYNLPSLMGEFFLKVPKNKTFTKDQLVKRTRYSCPPTHEVNVLARSKNAGLSFMLWFACVIGGIEIVVFFVWFFLIRNQQDVISAHQSQLNAVTGFKRFTYDELKKATRNFSKEIGRGAGGIVYKALLLDDRIAAVKVLSNATTGEADFLAEASTIGRVNHINLIGMWGFCAEGKHRLLVYEFMEHGSLAQNLSSPELHWKRRFDIVVGTAKGLAYLHDECLEWVLHCDVKPQNILLVSDYQPKVMNSDFSRIRGTRGYMAPDWVSNLPITSKVDVYSFGIVMLEIVTGISPTTSVHSMESGRDVKHSQLVPWVRNKMKEAGRTGSRIEEMVDPTLKDDYDLKKMEILIEVALKCVEEDRNARPTMSQVVEMLMRHENDG
ncbi:hypothetical protein BT93_F1436 [Corymbia citriodora subsp. variegata]|nr:hypothetical protein BT93_F1436 [Corymbia citriodora subsp. variegata]